MTNAYITDWFIYLLALVLSLRHFTTIFRLLQLNKQATLDRWYHCNLGDDYSL